jgi:hypothetical protein
MSALDGLLHSLLGFMAPSTYKAHLRRTITQPWRNREAAALLRSWRTEDARTQCAEWEELRRVLEEDRLSDRPLFP